MFKENYSFSKLALTLSVHLFVVAVSGCNVDDFKYRSDATNRTSANTSPSTSKNDAIATASNVSNLGAYYSFASSNSSTAQTLFARGGCSIAQAFDEALARNDALSSTQAYCRDLSSREIAVISCAGAGLAIERIGTKTRQLMDLCANRGLGNEALAAEIINDARDYRAQLGLSNPR